MPNFFDRFSFPYFSTLSFFFHIGEEASQTFEGASDLYRANPPDSRPSEEATSALRAKGW